MGNPVAGGSSLIKSDGADEAALLQTKALSINFGGHRAVDDVSASYPAGQLTAIVGPNGAGKTTYFNLISGQLRATSGVVRLDGIDITRMPAAHRARLGLGRAFQLTNLFPRLTVFENIRLVVQSMSGGDLSLWRLWSDRGDVITKTTNILDVMSLTARRDDIVANLPHGDQRKLEVAMLAAMNPKVYMFDEPTAGMSADEVPTVLALIRQLKGLPGKTILLVEHKMDVVRDLADRIVVLQDGRLVADGDPVSVIASPVVQQAYLGKSARVRGAE